MHRQLDNAHGRFPGRILTFDWLQAVLSSCLLLLHLVVLRKPDDSTRILSILHSPAGLVLYPIVFASIIRPQRGRVWHIVAIGSRGLLMACVASDYILRYVFSESILGLSPKDWAYVLGRLGKAGVAPEKIGYLSCVVVAAGLALSAFVSAFKTKILFPFRITLLPIGGLWLVSALLMVGVGEVVSRGNYGSTLIDHETAMALGRFCDFSATNNNGGFKNTLTYEDGKATVWPAVTNSVVVFIVESLRWDMINGESTPFMASSRNGPHYISKLYSGGNCTYLSWYSILQGTPATEYWALSRSPRPRYGRALQEYLDAGFRIEAISSAELSYRKIESMCLDSRYGGAINITVTRSPNDEPAWRIDERTIRTLQGKLKEAIHPTLFLVFLDSPHFPYSSPPPHGRRSPVMNEEQSLISLLFPHFSNNVGRLYSSYSDAIKYVDSLIDRVVNDSLVEGGLPTDPAFFVTGDHGEEFLENGFITHGGAINATQTVVPMVWIPTKSRPRVHGRPPSDHSEILGFCLRQMNNAELPPKHYSIIASEITRKSIRRWALVANGGKFLVEDHVDDNDCVTGRRLISTIDRSGVLVKDSKMALTALRMALADIEDDHVLQISQ